MKRSPALTFLLLLTALATTGCVSAAERQAQDRARRATVEVTTVRGRPVLLELVAANDGPSLAGVSYVRIEEWGEALTQLQIATDQKNHDHRAWFALGAVYEKTGRLDQAYDAYRQAFFLRNEPDYEDAWRRVRAKRGRGDAAAPPAR